MVVGSDCLALLLLAWSLRTLLGPADLVDVASRGGELLTAERMFDYGEVILSHHAADPASAVGDAPGGTAFDGTALGDALTVIAKGIGAARDAVTFTTDPNMLGDLLCELGGLSTELAALKIVAAEQARTNGTARTIGVRTIAQYVAARTNQSAADTRHDLLLARWLRDYPAFAAALERRDMTLQHLRHLRTAVENPRTYMELRGAQQLFIDAARDCSFEDFKYACAYWMISVDPDGEEPKDQIEQSCLRFRTGAGNRVTFTAETDAISGNTIKTAVRHEARKLREQDNASGVIRSDSQRAIAALTALVAKGFEREDGTYPVPLVNVVMSQKVLEWAHRQQSTGHHDGSVPVDAFDVDGRCELIDGTPVHPSLVLAMTGLVKFDLPVLRRYVLDADSRLIDFSVSARTHPEYMRTAVMVQARGQCETVGCDAPFHWLQVDHTDPHSHGGPISVGNAQAQCAADNHAKTDLVGQTAHRDRLPPSRYRRRRRHRHKHE